MRKVRDKVFAVQVITWQPETDVHFQVIAKTSRWARHNANIHLNQHQYNMDNVVDLVIQQQQFV